MKTTIALVLALVCVLSLAACSNTKDKETVSFHDMTFNKSDLSEETLKWLEWYNGLTETEQLSISYIPSDLYELCGYSTAEDAIADETVETVPSVSEEVVVGGDLAPMVMIDGFVYIDIGEESARTERVDNFDGEITSTVAQNKKPTENNQSNFGTGYGYQYGPNGTIEILINGKWCVFAIMADAV